MRLLKLLKSIVGWVLIGLLCFTVGVLVIPFTIIRGAWQAAGYAIDDILEMVSA